MFNIENMTFKTHNRQISTLQTLAHTIKQKANTRHQGKSEKHIVDKYTEDLLFSNRKRKINSVQIGRNKLPNKAVYR